MRTPIKLTMTLYQALNVQGACLYAAEHYAMAAAEYPQGDDLRIYFEKRARESKESADLVREAIVNPKWESQLDVIHECSHNY